jgi:cation transport regulator ChaB
MPTPTRKQDLPRTIQRSDEHAQHIYAKTHDSAVETYGEGRRAHQTAFAALKHEYRKTGDHWEKKDHKGPSDPQAARSSTSSQKSTDKPKSTSGGKEVPLDDWTKDDLYNQAQNLEIAGRSKMSKDELVKAIKKAG